MRMVARLLALGCLMIAAPAYAYQDEEEGTESSDEGAEIDSARGPRGNEAEIDSAESEDQAEPEDQGEAEEPEA